MNYIKVIGDWLDKEEEKADEDEHVIRGCIKAFGVGCLEGLCNTVFCCGLILIGYWIIELFKNKVNE